MKYFPILGSLAVAFLSTLSGWAAGSALQLASDHSPDFFSSAQGYLGVELGEIDPDHVSALRLKDDHGAEITMIDHDAPARKAGLRLKDVILQLDGQPFDNVDQLRKRLHEILPGHTVTLLVSRDGSPLNITVQLCDQAVLQHQAWTNHYTVQAPTQPAQSGGESFLAHPKPTGPGFLRTVIPTGLYVGADVNPVRTQLADYFGVRSGTGLLVESVDDQSPAAHAGLKAGDVIVKVASESMIKRSDWEKVLHKNRGQLVQVTVMRNKEEQILTMSVGKLKKQ